MDFQEYQNAARTTAKYDGQGEFLGLCYAGLGLNGEAGEVAEKIKKLWRDHGTMNDEIRQGIIKELGDTLWYAAAVAEEIGVSLNVVAQINLDKLRDRHQRGVLGGSGDER